MSQSIGILDITFKAGADLSSSQYAPVKLGTNPGEVVACGAGEEAVGILQNLPKVGHAAQVRVAGTSIVRASGEIAKGSTVAAAADARVAVADTPPVYAIGLTLEAAATDGDLVEMLIRPQLLQAETGGDE